MFHRLTTPKNMMLLKWCVRSLRLRHGEPLDAKWLLGWMVCLHRRLVSQYNRLYQQRRTKLLRFLTTMTPSHYDSYKTFKIRQIFLPATRCLLLSRFFVMLPFLFWGYEDGFRWEKWWKHHDYDRSFETGLANVQWYSDPYQREQVIMISSASCEYIHSGKLAMLVRRVNRLEPLTRANPFSRKLTRASSGIFVNFRECCISESFGWYTNLSIRHSVQLFFSAVFLRFCIRY